MQADYAIILSGLQIAITSFSLASMLERSARRCDLAGKSAWNHSGFQ